MAFWVPGFALAQFSVLGEIGGGGGSESVYRRFSVSLCLCHQINKMISYKEKFGKSSAVMYWLVVASSNDKVEPRESKAIERMLNSFQVSMKIFTQV